MRRRARSTRLMMTLALVPLASMCRRDRGEGISAVGTLEVAEVDVAPMVTARVVRVWVDDGAAVRRGDTLLALMQSTLDADIDQRRARVHTAEATLRELQAGARPAELERTEAELRAAEAEATSTLRDAARLAELAKEGAVSEQQIDAVRTSATTAANRRDAVRETLRLLRQGARAERIAAARSEVESARGALAAVRATQSDLVLISPVDGEVLGRHAEPGEVIPAGVPAMTIGETARPWVRVYLSQLDVPRLRVGQPATATLDGLPDRRFEGRVVAINDKAEFTPRVALTEEERADLVFGVKVEFADSSGTLRPGLPVTVRFPLLAPEQAVVTPDRE